jgi:hypothetical protein
VPNPAPRPERDFCSNCGFPVRGSRCEACGSTQDTLPARDAGDDVPTRENQLRSYVSQVDDDLAGLERAVDAFRAKELPHFVELLLASEAGAPARSAPAPDGPGWVTTVRGAVVFVTLRTAADELVLEAPIARLPGRRRLPALRLALELCARDAAASRVCLRGELLLLRFTARLSLLTPPVLRHYLREIGHLGARYAGLLAVSLDAPPAIPDGQRAAVGFDAIGRARKIHLGAGSSVHRSMPPPSSSPRAQDTEPVVDRRARTERVVGRKPPRDDEPSYNGAITPREPVPRPVTDAIPAVLSPVFSASKPLTASKVSRAGELELDSAHDASSRHGSRRFDGKLSGHEGASRAPAADPAPSASDRLCMLLRLAQSLASLTLEERPATMMWLVRSAVFRAIYEFKDLLPDAVAHLYRCTGMNREAPGSTRVSSGQLQATEPALVVMERVIVARGQVQREKPLAIEPMTSAAQAKEHVARYLLEIERSPSDPPLRHFLALGALTELLVRTKLPPQTDQRLRDIVAHAQREGAKSQAIDLMMTALQRINA